MASRAAILRAAQASPGAAQPTYPPQGGSPWIGQLPSYSMEPGSGYSRQFGPFLERPAETFTSGAFGPFSPILPVPINQPPEGFDRPRPRRWQPPVGWNLPVGVPGTEGYRLTSYATMKTLADSYSILRTCLEIRKNEIRALEWDIALTPDAANAYQGDREAMRDFGERKAQAIKFFKRPDSDYDDFGSWLHALADQLFVYDALSVYLCPKKGRGLGRGLFGSDLDELWAIDGTSIRPLAGLHGERPRPPAPGYQQFEFGVPRADLTTIVAGLDLDGSEGRLQAMLRGDQLLYRPYLRRTDSPYGFSLVEQALIPIMTGLRKQAFQLDYFNESTVPRVWLSPGDSTMTPNQCRELQDAVNAIAGDLAWAFKVMVIPPNSKIIPQKDVQIVDDSDNWIATEVAMVANISPVEIGLLPKVSAMASPFAAREMAQAARSIHERTATKPTLAFLAAIPDFILQVVCGQDDMRFIFEGMEQTQDLAALTDMGIKQVQSGVKTIDEFRDDLHMTRFNLPETRSPVVFTQLGPIPLGQAAAQARTMATGTQAAGEGHRAVSGTPQRKALPAGSSGQGRMNGPVTQRQARRGGALAPAHATGEGAPGHSGGKPTAKAARPDDTEAFQDRGEPVRQRFGIDGTAGDAMDEPHPFTADRPLHPEWCVACGMGRDFDAHKCQCCGGAGEHPTGHECYKCDAGMYPSAREWASPDCERVFRDPKLHAKGCPHCGKPPFLGSGSPSPVKAVLAELEALGRHLNKGMHASEWVPVHITGDVMAIIAEDLGKGLSAPYVIETAMKAHRRPPERQSHQQVQAQLSAQYQQQVRAAFAQAISQAQALIAQWITGTLAVTAAVLASMIADLIRAALLPVLISLWTAAWDAAVTDAGGNPADLQAELEAFLATLGQDWASLISGTGMAALLAAITAALRAGDVTAILDMLWALLGVDARSEQIAVSEVTRAWNAGLFAWMKRAGVAYKQWVTSGLPNVCAVCRANAAQGTVPLDALFKSGDLAPLAHVNCACHLEAAQPKPFTGKRLRREIGLNGQETWVEWTPQPDFSGGRIHQPHRGDGTMVPGVPGAMTGGEPPRWDGSEPEPVTEHVPEPDFGEDAGIGPRPSAGAPPGAYWPAPYMDGWFPSPAGHGTGQPGGQSPGGANGRPPSPAGKASKPSRAAAFAKAAPKAKASDVRAVMEGNFPPSALGWVGRIRWSGPAGIPLELIDTSHSDQWAARHEQGHVDQIARDMQAGKPVNPVITVMRKGHGHYRMIDGRHRVEAARKLGRPVTGYIGWLDDANEKAAYDTYHQQFHSGDSPQNKSFTAGSMGIPGAVSGLVPLRVQGQHDETSLPAPPPGRPYCAGLVVQARDTGRVLMLQRAATEADDGAGLLEWPGGHADDGEPLLAAAMREWAEETGLPVPAGQLAGRWESSNGVYAGFVMLVSAEADVDLGARDLSANPDGDSYEAVLWMDPAALGGNRAVRDEVRTDLPLVQAALAGSVAKSAETPVVSMVHHPLGHEGLWHTPSKKVPEMQQLPAYHQNTARALMRDQGMDEHRAIATAINAIREWKHGRAFGGRVKVTPQVQAAAARADAEFERLRAAHH